MCVIEKSKVVVVQMLPFNMSIEMSSFYRIYVYFVLDIKYPIFKWGNDSLFGWKRFIWFQEIFWPITLSVPINRVCVCAFFLLFILDVQRQMWPFLLCILLKHTHTITWLTLLLRYSKKKTPHEFCVKENFVVAVNEIEANRLKSYSPYSILVMDKISVDLFISPSLWIPWSTSAIHSPHWMAC